MTERKMLPVLDNSAVSTFAECPRKFFYQYVLHYQKPISSALHFGRVWHRMLDTWYTSGGDTAAAKEAGTVEWGTIQFTDDHRTIFRAWEAFDKYVKEYGKDKSDIKQTLGFTEGAPLVEIAIVLRWPEIPLDYVGKIDRVIQLLNSEVYVNDHKSTARLDASFFRGFEMSPQMLGYTKLVSTMLDTPVEGVMVNAYNITPTGKSDRFERQFIQLPRSRVEHWATVILPAQMHAIIAAHETDTWLMNPVSCTTKYGLCSYFDVCTSPEKRRASVLDLNYEQRQWNPLDAAN